ncbi:IclR family transcriptional regulator [Halobacterium sp. KA-4]|uniref:IclR family transcriptional regulator n=1 Tax=Halobacterium sp. KA-4 TaxID=2896367 RepID=UPI001E323027|nr:IclR family transcriptional regulator [Halobacterium sp. KA-4]MCD2201679.1 IclR family transcriptional regulator [Halobacterium sp. KA-4]
MTPDQPPKPKRPVKTADKMAKLFVVLQEKELAGVTELADELDLAKSTTYHYLATLQSEGYISKEGEKYRLGLRFLEHAVHVNRNLGVRPAVRPVIEDLAEETGEAVWFLFEEHSFPIFLSRELGEQGVVSFRQIGKAEPATAGGKAVLAQYSEEEMKNIVTYLSRKHPEYVLPEPDTYVERVEGVAERGYATTVEEVESGVASVGAPVIRDDSVVGAVEVAGPTKRLEETLWDDLPGLVTSAANDIEIRLSNPDGRNPVF